jgi:hypothetical protein
MPYVPPPASGGPGGGAPTDATYITQTGHADLSAEQSLSGLTTGLVKVTNGTGVLSTAAAGTDYAAASHSHAAVDVSSGTLDIARIPTGTTGTTVALGDHTHANDHVRSHSVTSASDHSFPGGTTTFLRADGTFATPTAAASLTSSQAFATATTTISTATYAGTASLNSPFSCNPIAIVSPVGTTTYKLRGARGLTTHTGSWIAVDGNGVNTLNHASNNTDKGTGIFAVKIA